MTNAKIKRVYVAGTMSPTRKDEHPVVQFLDNIRKGQRASVEVLFAGFTPFSPFLDFQYWFQLRNNEKITEKMIKALSMDWLEVSDAVLVTHPYRASSGTLAEIARARELGIPVFYSLDDLIAARDADEEN